MTSGLPSTEIAASSPVSLIIGVQVEACGDDCDPNTSQHASQQPVAAGDAGSIEGHPNVDDTYAGNLSQVEVLPQLSESEGAHLSMSESDARDLPCLPLGADVSDVSDTDTHKYPTSELLEVGSNADSAGSSSGQYQKINHCHIGQGFKSSIALPTAGGTNPPARPAVRRTSNAGAPPPPLGKVCDLILDMDAAAAAVSAALTGIPGGPPASTRKNCPSDGAGPLGARHCGAVLPPPPPPPPPRRSLSHHTTASIATSAGALFGLHPKAGALYPFSFLHQHQAPPPPPPPPRQYLRTLSQSSQPYHLSPACLPTTTSGRVTTRIANVVGVGAAGCHMSALTPPTAQSPITASGTAAVPVGAGSGESPEATQYPSLATELPPRWRFSISGPIADLGRDFTAPQRPIVRWHASSSGLATDLPPYQYGFQQTVVSPSYLQAPSMPPPQQQQHPFHGQVHPLLVPTTSQAQLQHLQSQPLRQGHSGPVLAQQQHHLQQQQQLDRATTNRLLALSQLQQQLGAQSAATLQTTATAAAAVSATLAPLPHSLPANMLVHPHSGLLTQAQTSPAQHSPFVGVLGLKEMGFDVCSGGDMGTTNAAGSMGARAGAGGGTDHMVAAVAGSGSPLPSGAPVATAAGGVVTFSTSPRPGHLQHLQFPGTQEGEQDQERGQGQGPTQLLGFAASDSSRQHQYNFRTEEPSLQQQQQQLLAVMAAAAAAWQRPQGGAQEEMQEPLAVPSPQQQLLLHKAQAQGRPSPPLSMEGTAQYGSPRSGSQVPAVAGGRLQAIMQDDPIALVRLYERSLAAAMAEAQCGRGPVSKQQLHHEHELLQGIASLLAGTAAAAATAQLASPDSGDAEDVDIDLELAMLLVSARRHSAEWPNPSEPYKYGILVTARALSLGLLDAAGKGQALNERLYGAVQPLLYTLAETDEPFLGMLRAAMPPLPAVGTATAGSESSSSVAGGDATPADNSAAAAPAAASPKLARSLIEALCTVGETAMAATAGSDPAAAPRDWSWRARVPGGACDSDCDTVRGSSSGGAAGVTAPNSTQGEFEPSEDDTGVTGMGGSGGAAAAAKARGMPLQPEIASQDLAAGGGGGGSNNDPQRYLGRSSSAPANREARGRLLNSLFSSFNNNTERTNDGGAAGCGGFGSRSGALDAGTLAHLLDDGQELLGAAAAAALGGWHAGGASDSGGGPLDSSASSSVLASFLESFGAASRSSMALSPLLDGCSSSSMDMSSLSLSIHPSPRTSPANPLGLRRELAAAVAGAEINSTATAAAAAAVPPPSGPQASKSSAQPLLAASQQGAPGAAGLVQVQLPPPTEYGPAVAAAAAAMAAAAATGPAIRGLAGSPYGGFPLDMCRMGAGGQMRSLDMLHFHQQALSNNYHIHCQQQQAQQQYHQQPLDAAAMGGLSDPAAEALLGALDSHGDLDTLSWDSEAIQAALRILQATAQLDG